MATGTIVIEEQIEPAGSLATFNFVAEVGFGGGTGIPTSITGIADGERHTISGVLPGTVNVVQRERAGTSFLPAEHDLWELSEIVCDDANSSGDVEIKTATFRVEAGETVTCVFKNNDLRTGTIVIEEQIEPAGSLATFNFVAEVGLGGGTGLPTSITGIADGERHTISGVLPGTVNVVQRERAGTTFLPAEHDLWELSEIVCDDANSSGDVEIKTATFRVEAGETVTCVFKNNDLRTGTIVIEEQIEPAGSLATFNFVAEVGLGGGTGIPTSITSIADGERHTISGVLPGTVNVVQRERASTTFLPAEHDLWELSEIVCDDANSSGDVELKTATFRVEAGETVTCVFKNKDLRTGTIVIEEQIEPAGSLATFNFVAEVGFGGGTGIPTSITGIADGERHTISGVLPGSVNVVQRERTGFALNTIDCDDANSIGDSEVKTATFRVEAGETVTCVFRNSPTSPPSGESSGTIVLRLATSPAAAHGDFRFLPASGITTGPLSTSASYTLNDGQSITQTALRPGTYSVSERDPRFDFKVADIRCSEDGTNDSAGDVARRIAIFRVQPGETVTCTFLNEDLRTGTIKLVKQTDPPNAHGDFRFLPASGITTGPLSTSASYTLNDGQSITQTALRPGTYSVSERDPRFDFKVADIRCSEDGTNDSAGDVARRIAIFRVQPGETVTCTFLNERAGFGRIVVEKQTLPSGDSQTFCYTASYDGDGFCLSDGRSNTSSLLSPGSYSVSEQALEGWDQAVTCSDGSPAAIIQLAAEETVTCRFLNTKRGSVTLKKTTNGVVDPTKEILFVLTGPGLPSGGVVRSTFGDQDGVLQFGNSNLIPGEPYTMCESPVPAGFTSFWKLDGEIVTPVNPDAGNIPPEDLGDRCDSFEIVTPGQSRAYEVDNSHPGGDPRTIGYWKNWNRCTSGNQAASAAKSGGAAAGFFLVEDLVPQDVGDFSVAACEQAVKLLSKQDQGGKNNASDAAYELGAQLLAAHFNLAAGAETCTAVQQAVLDGHALLAGIEFSGSGDYLGSKSKSANRPPAVMLAGTLDRYNNGDLC